MATLTIDGVDSRTAYGFALEQAPAWRDTPSKSYQTAPIYGVAGVVVLGAPQEQPRNLQLRGTITGTTVADLQTKRDALILALSSVDGHQFVFADAPTRYITAKLAGFSTNPGNGPSMIAYKLGVDISLTAFDPYYYDTTTTTVNVAAQTTIPLGNAPVRPVLTFPSVPAGDLTITLYTTGSVVAQQMVIGPLTAGHTLIVDCDLKTITDNGVNALAILKTGDFFKIDPVIHRVAGADPKMQATASNAFTAVYNKAWRA